MFHLAAYRLAAPGAVTFADVPAIADGGVTIVNNHFIFPINVEVPLAYVFGSATLTQAKISTPKLRVINEPFIRPLDRATVTPTSRPPYADWWRMPLRLNKVDETQIKVSDTAGATDILGLMWVCDGNYNAPDGEMFTVHATATNTGAANVWTSSTFTLDNPLPAGVYSVVGMDAFGANLVAARLIFPAYPGAAAQVWRPGVMAGVDPTFIPPWYTRLGRMGEFGRFESFAQPNLEILPHGGAGVTQDIYLDLVRVGGIAA